MMRPSIPWLPLSGLLLAAVLAAGCDSNGEFMTDARLENGLVIILPGIEGESELNQNVRRGLVAAGVERAIPIHSWGRPIPIAGVLINQVDFLGNRLAGIGVADVIKNYQDSHPGKPVYVIGHSGGGGVAVFTAEALPEDRKIDGLILLSASISSAYNLTKPLSRCKNGIVNFYNPDDAGLLGIGTTVMGTVDGTHGPSAGLIGFDAPRDRDKEDKKAAYRKLYQVKLTGSARDGDPHTSTTHVDFVATNVAPWVLADSWPAGPVLAGGTSLPSRPGSDEEEQGDPAAANQPAGEPTGQDEEPADNESKAAPEKQPADDQPGSKGKPAEQDKRHPKAKPQDRPPAEPGPKDLASKHRQ